MYFYRQCLQCTVGRDRVMGCWIKERMHSPRCMQVSTREGSFGEHCFLEAPPKMHETRTGGVDGDWGAALITHTHRARLVIIQGGYF